jgi:hypothetical protein
MPRTYARPAQIDVRKAQARTALAAYTEWQVTGKVPPSWWEGYPQPRTAA